VERGQAPGTHGPLPRHHLNWYTRLTIFFIYK
jgi:hypothetical protein